jgi:hypothetical protein
MNRCKLGMVLLLVVAALARGEEDFFATLTANRARGGHTYVNGTVNVAPLAGLGYAELTRGVSSTSAPITVDASRGPVTAVNVVVRLEQPLVVWTTAGSSSVPVEIAGFSRQRPASGPVKGVGAVVLAPGVQPKVVNHYVDLARIEVRQAPSSEHAKAVAAAGPTAQGGRRD